MATAGAMILRALNMLGEKRIGETLTVPEETAYLSVLNAMLESWSLERLMIYQILQESFTLTGGTASYTIGTGGDFNTTRPTRIVKAFIRDTNMDMQLTILGFNEFDNIAFKTSGDTYPAYLFHDAGASLSTIRVYPKPQSGLTLFIDSWKQLQNFPTVATVLTMPPGYQRAIESNLALELSPGFINVDAAVIAIAKSSKANIKSFNMPDVIMRLDPGVMNYGGNILTGP